MRKILLFMMIPALVLSCKKIDDVDNTRSLITATIDGRSYSTTNVFITKDPNTNDLLFFNSLTPDSIAIGIRLVRTSPAYQQGSYSFRPSGTTGVILVSFAIQSISNQPQLSWVTDQETALDRFVIERSTDGINFLQIGTVNALGSTSAASNYSFTDNSSLNVQNYYYRLKMVNLDGSLIYSSIRSYPGNNYIAYYGKGSKKFKGFNGTVLVTTHDRVAHIVYGTFFFDYINTAGETKQVRNGSFKIIY